MGASQSGQGVCAVPPAWLQRGFPTPPQKQVWRKPVSTVFSLFHRSANNFDTQMNVSTDMMWPAPAPSIAAASGYLRRVAAQQGRILLVPDRDADGLCAGNGW
jgi:hypothetical protein